MSLSLASAWPGFHTVQVLHVMAAICLSAGTCTRLMHHFGSPSAGSLCSSEFHLIKTGIRAHLFPTYFITWLSRGKRFWALGTGTGFKPIPLGVIKRDPLVLYITTWITRPCEYLLRSLLHAHFCIHVTIIGQKLTELNQCHPTPPQYGHC